MNGGLMHEGVMHESVMRDSGSIRVDTHECKGCGLCIEACPPKVISLSEQLNHFGYRTAAYAGSGCNGCEVCFFACPEPGAITVLRLDSGMNRKNALKASGKEAAA